MPEYINVEIYVVIMLYYNKARRLKWISYLETITILCKK